MNMHRYLPELDEMNFAQLKALYAREVGDGQKFDRAINVRMALRERAERLAAGAPVAEREAPPPESASSATLSDPSGVEDDGLASRADAPDAGEEVAGDVVPEGTGMATAKSEATPANRALEGAEPVAPQADVHVAEGIGPALAEAETVEPETDDVAPEGVASDAPSEGAAPSEEAASQGSDPGPQAVDGTVLELRRDESQPSNEGQRAAMTEASPGEADGSGAEPVSAAPTETLGGLSPADGSTRREDGTCDADDRATAPPDAAAPSAPQGPMGAAAAGDSGPDGSALSPTRRRARVRRPQPTIDELRAIYVEVIKRPTSSFDPHYLKWKVREARKGRVPIGPREAPGSAENEQTARILSFRISADAADALDRVWPHQPVRNRNDFLRRAVAMYLESLGASDEARIFSAA